MAYADLVASGPVNAYSKANDLTTDLNRLIVRAHDNVVMRIDHDLFATTATGIAVDTDGIVNVAALGAGIPERIMEFRSVQVQQADGSLLMMEPRDDATLRALFPTDPQGDPRYYETTYNVSLRVWPRPFFGTVATLRYNLRPLAPSVVNTTNIIMDRHPPVMEFAVAREIAVYLLDMEMAATFGEELDKALNALNSQLTRRKRDETTQRPTETRNIVGQ